MAGTVHVVGAGLAGLSAAVSLVERGARVIVHEAAKQAGGRCRSYYDPTLGLTIDNGNHLLLSGNTSALGFMRTIGAPASALSGPDEAAFPFADLKTGERWTLRPNAGRVPWWVLQASRRVPGTSARDYLAPLGILKAAAGKAPGQGGDHRREHGLRGYPLRTALAPGTAGGPQTPIRRRATRASPRRSCARRSERAERPAGPSSRSRGSRPPSSTRRWPI